MTNSFRNLRPLFFALNYLCKKGGECQFCFGTHYHIMKLSKSFFNHLLLGTCLSILFSFSVAATTAVPHPDGDLFVYGEDHFNTSITPSYDYSEVPSDNVGTLILRVNTLVNAPKNFTSHSFSVILSDGLSSYSFELADRYEYSVTTKLPPGTYSVSSGAVGDYRGELNLVSNHDIIITADKTTEHTLYFSNFDIITNSFLYGDGSNIGNVSIVKNGDALDEDVVLLFTYNDELSEISLARNQDSMTAALDKGFYHISATDNALNIYPSFVAINGGDNITINVGSDTVYDFDESVTDPTILDKVEDSSEAPTKAGDNTITIIVVLAVFMFAFSVGMLIMIRKLFK